MEGENIFKLFQSVVFVKRIPCVLNFLSLIENVSPRTFTIVFNYYLFKWLEGAKGWVRESYLCEIR
jgi:hypothetical protein